MSQRYELLDNEKTPKFAKIMHGVMIATFYDRIKGSDHSASQQQLYLKYRISKILSANAWLMGRLHFDEEKDEAYLTVNSAESNPSDYIVEETNDQVFNYKSFNDLREKFKPYQIGKGHELMNESLEDEKRRLAKIGLIKNSKNDKLCVFVVISHVIADAGTIYAIYKMLDENQNIVALDRSKWEMEGYKNYPEYGMKNTSLYPDVKDPVTANMENLYKIVIPAQMRNAQKRKDAGISVDCVLVKIDMDEVDRIKQQFKNIKTDQNEIIEFVSTNDVLVSWLSKLCPKADCMTIAFTLRNRIPGVTFEKAGNYITGVTARKSDLENPAIFRSFVNSRMNPGKSWKFPTAEDRADFSGGASTNWSSFYNHLEIPGYQQIMHVPVPDEMVAVYNGLELCADLVQCIYQVNKNEIGVLLISGREDVRAGLQLSRLNSYASS